MKDAFYLAIIPVGFLSLALTATALAEPESTPAGKARVSGLQALVDDAVHQTLAKFAGQQLKPDQIAVTLVDLRDREHPVCSSYRGDAQIYPASVVKLFYLVAAHRWLEDGRLQDTEELRRAMHDMIVDSYNEATHYIVDLLTGTTSGPELSVDELTE